METNDGNDGISEISRTLEQLAFTAAALIYSDSDSLEQNNRILDGFETAVQDNIRRRSSSHQNGAHN
jgi:hypothetical protein